MVVVDGAQGVVMVVDNKIKLDESFNTYLNKLQYEYNANLQILIWILQQDNNKFTKEERDYYFFNTIKAKIEFDLGINYIKDNLIPNEFKRLNNQYNYNLDFKEGYFYYDSIGCTT